MKILDGYLIQELHRYFPFLSVKRGLLLYHISRGGNKLSTDMNH